MAGPYTPVIIFRNRNTGQRLTLNLYFAGSDAAGYVVPSNWGQAAGAGSPKDFVLPDGIWDIEHQTGPATGKLRVWVNGQPSPVAYDMATVISMVTRAGMAFGAIRGGTQYRHQLVVDSVCAA